MEDYTEDFTASYNLSLDNAIDRIEQASAHDDITKYHLILSKDEALKVAKAYQIPLHQM